MGRRTRSNDKRRRADRSNSPRATADAVAQDIFADRRRQPDRRQQALPIPSRMCRRNDERRQNAFSSKPWWLQVGYTADSDKSPASDEG